MRYDGGCKELAQCIGLKGKRDIIKLGDILYALNYIVFTTEQITSRLINIAQYKSAKLHRNDGLETTVLSPLLPYRIFKDKGLLVPLLQEPPLVGRPNEWAKQLLLQWMLAEEFQRQSISLAKYGYIEVPNEKWEELAYSCEIPKNTLSKIKEYWTQDSTDAPRFLDHIENDFYTLGIAHKKELVFLPEQGKLRANQSKRGKQSATNRKKKKNDKPYNFRTFGIGP